MLLLLLLVTGCRTSQDRLEARRTDVVASQHGWPPGDAPAGTSAKTAAPRPGSTLAEMQQYAARRNPELRAAFERWKAAVERAPQVRSLPDPKFTYTYYLERVETRVGPQRHRFMLTQTFPWYEKLLLRGGVAAAQARAAYHRFERQRLQLRAQVARAYADYYYVQHAVESIRESMDLLQSWEEVVQARFEAAAAEHPDLVRVQVELGKLEDQLASLRDLQGPRAAQLNALLDRPAAAPLPGPFVLPDPPAAQDRAALLAQLQEQNPELHAMDEEIAAAQQAVELARRSAIPDATLGFGYIETGSSRMPQPDSGKDPVTASVTLNLPIWTERYRAEAREAVDRAAAVRHARRGASRRLAADLVEALFGVTDAERKLELYSQTLIPKTEEALYASLRAYQVGKGTFLDLIDQQRTLLEFQLAMEEARARRAAAQARLEALVGQGVESAPVPERS
jgi:outer membrane protein TolC